MRLKFIGVSLLLCIALAATVLAAASTIQAYQQFQQKHQRIQVGDVSTISSWMTLPYVAHVYHVPAACLDESLHVSLLTLQKHATLRYLADYYKKPVDTVIYTVQRTILDYRAKRLVCSSPPSMVSARVQQLPMSEIEGKPS